MLPLRFFAYSSDTNSALDKEFTEFILNDRPLTVKSSFPLVYEGHFVGAFWGFTYGSELKKDRIISTLIKELHVNETEFLKKLNTINGTHCGFIYDRSNRKLYFWNDALGTTPLYHSTKNGKLLISTDLNLFKAPEYDLNEDWLRKFILDDDFNEPPEGGEVAVKDVRRLERATVIVVETETMQQTHRTYKNTEQELQHAFANPQATTFEEAAEQVENILTENMQSMMDGYANPGITISGGSDSYLVYAIGRKIGLNWKILNFDYDHLFTAGLNPSMPDIMNSLPEEKFIFKLDGYMRKNAYSYFRNFPPKINEKPYLHNAIFKKLSADSGIDILFNGILGDPFFGHRINYYVAMQVHRKFSADKKNEIISIMKSNIHDVRTRKNILDTYLSPLVNEIENKSSYILCDADLKASNIDTFFLECNADYVSYILKTTNTYNWSSRDWSDMGLPTASPINDSRLFMQTLRWPPELLARNSLNIEIQRHITKKYLRPGEFKLRNKFDELTLAPFWKYQLTCTEEVLSDFRLALDFTGKLFGYSPIFLSKTEIYKTKKTLCYNEVKILSLYYWYKNWSA